ncbi:MAG: gamma-glutamyltransferase, partial [Alphaproteobacteria bacterium]|nr:gamma-glutamyltransferase [Alphaproteobacteria bacterium]
MLSDIQDPTKYTATSDGAAVVTAAVSEAADAGLAMFNKGGNAFDAALAAAFAETIWLPMKCGLAGDIVALFKRPGDPVRAMLAIGRGPLALAQGARLTATGPCSIGGAGAPEGYARLAGYGDLSLQSLLEPAIRMAQEGVKWTPVAVRLTEESEALLRKWNGDIPYLPNGKLPQVGADLHLPGLAKLLQAFGRDQGRLFHGEIGEKIISHVNDLEGGLQRDDMIRAVATEMPCDCTVLNETDTLFTTPHPTHGVVHAQALKGTLDGVPETQALAEAQDAFGSGATGGTSVVTAADSQGNRVVLV